MATSDVSFPLFNSWQRKISQTAVTGGLNPEQLKSIAAGGAAGEVMARYEQEASRKDYALRRESLNQQTAYNNASLALATKSQAANEDIARQNLDITREGAATQSKTAATSGLMNLATTLGGAYILKGGTLAGLKAGVKGLLPGSAGQTAVTGGGGTATGGMPPSATISGVGGAGQTALAGYEAANLAFETAASTGQLTAISGTNLAVTPSGYVVSLTPGGGGAGAGAATAVPSTGFTAGSAAGVAGIAALVVGGLMTKEKAKEYTDRGGVVGYAAQAAQHPVSSVLEPNTFFVDTGLVSEDSLIGKMSSAATKVEEFVVDTISNLLGIGGGK